MTLPNKTERRAIVDTHRHPWGQKMQSKIEERGLLDPKQGFPQTNALDLMAYREVFDLDYAMPIQREGGITLSLMTNGGEVEWLARDLLQPSTLEGLRFFNDEYVDIMNRYPGEFAPTANAHALEESCRPVVEEMIRQGGAKAIAVASAQPAGRLDRGHGAGSRRDRQRPPRASPAICPVLAALSYLICDHAERRVCRVTLAFGDFAF
jgi:hypothetical protein